MGAIWVTGLSSGCDLGDRPTVMKLVAQSADSGPIIALILTRIQQKSACGYGPLGDESMFWV